MKAMPFRVADPDCIVWTPPLFELDGRQLPEGPLADWTYQSRVRVLGHATVDREAMLRSTGLGTLDDVRVIMQVECLSTGFRDLSPQRILGSSVSLVVEIPPGTTAEQLEVRYGLLWDAPDRPQPDSMAVSVRGGRLLVNNTVHRAQLEGEGSGFPSEAFSFEAGGRYPRGALWYLAFRPELEIPFMANARIFINTDHKRAEDLLAGKRTVAQSVMFTGVLQQMLDTVAGVIDPEEIMIDTLDEGSTGAVLEELTTNYLHLGLADAIRQLRMDRPGITARLQEATGFLDRGIA